LTLGAAKLLQKETLMRGIHRTRQRQGFVLLTVTLIGALLFISALMFVSQLTTESHVTKTDAYFKSALNLAETGLNDTLMEISQSVSTPTWAIPFENRTTTVRTAVADDAVHGTYQVTVAVVGTPEVLGSDQYKGEIQVTSVGALYTPAVTAMVGSGDYAARRAVRSSTMAVWTYIPPQPGSPAVWKPPVYAPTTFNIRYGVFTGGNLVIKGSSQEIHGDVFANGDVYIQKASGLVGGDAYAAGTVTGGIPAGDKFPGQTPIPFPEMDIPLMRQLFDAYVTGKFPYDALNNQVVGAPAGTYYTCTNALVPGNKRAAFNVDLLLAAARIDPVTHLYELPPMTPITAAVRSALIDPTAVYYFDGNVKLASASALSGTIVIDGEFFISGNVEVGTAGTLVNIIATGNVTKATGCSLINGLVYTGGSFTGRGTADINGALIARNSVDMSGNFNVTYNGSIPPIATGGTLVTAGYWTEETAGAPAFYELNELNLPDSGERMWQEVTTIN
jgi:hypothetical protein